MFICWFMCCKLHNNVVTHASYFNVRRFSSTPLNSFKFAKLKVNFVFEMIEKKSKCTIVNGKSHQILNEWMNGKRKLAQIEVVEPPWNVRKAILRLPTKRVVRGLFSKPAASSLRSGLKVSFILFMVQNLTLIWWHGTWTIVLFLSNGLMTDFLLS